MLDDPEWAVYTVKSCDAFGQVRMMGATRSHDASLAVWETYDRKLPLEDVMLCHGVRVIKRSKPDWQLGKGKAK
jgi:hypothetical protein